MARFDTIEPGSFVRLDFTGHREDQREELAIFLGVSGEGDERHAKFVSVGSPSAVQYTTDGFPARSYEWEAYRYNGRWAYGTSAERLSLLEVLS